MAKEKYLFQIKKVSFTKRLFEKGLSVASFILLSLKENAELFAEEVPYSYPVFKILQSTFGAAKKGFKRGEILVNLRRLEKQGLIRKEPKRKIFVLTEKGKEIVNYIEDRYTILNKSWDGKLRVVIFDIPEKKRHYRIWLRNELLLLCFKEWQKSVYIGKYPLPKSFYQDIIRFGLGNFVFVFTATNIDKKEQVLQFLKE